MQLSQERKTNTNILSNDNCFIDTEKKTSTGTSYNHSFVSAESIAGDVHAFMAKIEPKWCPVCEASMNDVGGTCWRCNQAKFNNEKILQALEENKKWMIEKLGGLRAYEKYTLEKFTDKTLVKKLEPFPAKNYFIYGLVGRGKTHLAMANIRRCSDFEIITPVVFLRKMDAKNAQAKIDYLERLSIIPVLIDDLEIRKEDIESVKAARYIKELIDARYLRGGGGMIITTNMSMQELSECAEFDRIPSRLVEMCDVVKIDGEDKRLEKEQQDAYAAVDVLF